MRHSEKYLKKCSRRGKQSQVIQENERLAHAAAIRPVESILIFEMWTSNPTTGIKHHIEIRHDPVNGNNRYNVYLDGERWRNQWSRYRFVNWLFNQIDSVVHLN